MMKGICGKLLHIDLTRGTTEVREYPETFYRKYLGGGAFGTYFLLNGTDGNTDPLSPENIITIAPGITTGPAVSGVSRCSVTALSPETNAVGDTQAGGSLGPFLKRSGFDGVVISGRAAEPCHIYIHEGEAEIVPSSELVGSSILEAHDTLTLRYTKKVSILQCGPGGERLVRFAALASDLNNWCGRTGMGAVFGSKNLRAVVVSGKGAVDPAYPDMLKALARKGVQRVKEGKADPLKLHGTPGILEPNALKGNLSTHNYSTGFHPDYRKLIEPVYEAEEGARKATCYGCAVGCRKTVNFQKPYEVSDRLGGPEFETLGLLGANLEISDGAAVAKANELCNNNGIDTLTMGSLVSYLFELMERGLIDPELRRELPEEGFGHAESLLAIIEMTIERRGIGDILAEGIERTVAYLGEETSDYAVRTKNHGFAVHMPQVKQSMALMYAVSPIGADHMSCEHDWLAADDSEVAAGLGLHNPGEEISYGAEKVRAVIYSQYYYAALDSLGLCMFCWGPGSLFTYEELLQLIQGMTGWNATFWEIMKAAERRITMMRMLNTMRGFQKKDDILPKKMFVPLKDGPSQGRSVDKEGFSSMIDMYYGMMGWNPEGVPENGKLAELDLLWTAELGG